MSGCRHCALCEGVIGEAGSLHHTASQRGGGEESTQLAQEVRGGEGVARGHHTHSEVGGTWVGLLEHSSQLKDFQNTYTSGSVTKLQHLYKHSHIISS